MIKPPIHPATPRRLKTEFKRAQPNERTKVLGYLQNGEQVRILAMGKWWKIITDHGQGFANAKYLQITECK
jgi:hypothetical protein